MLLLCRCSTTLFSASHFPRSQTRPGRFCTLGSTQDSIASLQVDRPSIPVPGGIIPVQDGILASSPISAYEVRQGTDDWHELRQGRLTASSFSTALGFWGVDRRVELWEEKVGLRERFAGNPATQWGSSQEAAAVERYQKLTGNIVQSLGFKIYKEGDDVQGWLGASPDGLIDEGMCGVYEKCGILEVKCPHNKGKPELCVPWAAVPYYYMPQVQGLMEILDRDWVDLYVWTLNGSTIFRVERNSEYWTLIYGVLSDFWWANVVPAKQTILLQKNVDANIYRPVHLHRLTSVIIRESRTLASKAPLIWKDQGLKNDL
eukprot:c26390_g1_i1 orf=46-996(+)